MTPETTTDRGLVGGVERGGLLAFLGMPYAEPPIGRRRFLAPPSA